MLGFEPLALKLCKQNARELTVEFSIAQSTPQGSLRLTGRLTGRADRPG